MSNRAKTLLLILVDLLLLFSVMTIVVFLRKGGLPSEKYLFKHFELFACLFPLWILMFFIEGIYTLRTYNPANVPISIIRGTLFSVIISALTVYLLPFNTNKLTPKVNLVLIAIMSMPLLFTWKRFFFKFFANDRRLRNTLLIGSEETLDIVINELKQKPYLGYKVAGTSLPISNDIELIAVERNVTKDPEVYNQIFQRIGTGVEVIDLARFAEKVSGKIPIRSIDETWFVEYCGHQESRSYDVFKSILDKTVAASLLIILVPFALVFLPILLLVHGRPVFFTQLRTGLNNKPFTLYKLRTMVVDAEKSGAQWAKPGDARITPLGSFLRKTRVDELPQLINILRGDMSLVGPRPERPEIIESKLAPAINFFNLRHLVKPGVTGWAQVTFRYGFSTEDSKEKLQYDLFYVKNRSLWLDLLVILKTIKTVLTGAGQ